MQLGRTLTALGLSAAIAALAVPTWAQPEVGPEGPTSEDPRPDDPETEDPGTEDPQPEDPVTDDPRTEDPTSESESGSEGESESESEPATAEASMDHDHDEHDEEHGVLATITTLLPDISLVADIALAYFSEDDNLQTGAHDPQENGFNLQQLGLSVSKSVDAYFRLDASLVFSLEGVEIEEAYATTLDLPWDLQLRAGQFLTRFGRLNSTHAHSWDFVDQPFYFGKVWGGEGNRGLGAELSVMLPLPWYVELVGSTSHAAGEHTARSFYGADDQGVHDPLDFQNTAAIKQQFELGDDASMRFGVSAANGPNTAAKNGRADVYGSDLYVAYRPVSEDSYTLVSLQAEWLYRRRQIPHGVIHDTGGYAHLFWRFARRWGAAARYEYGSPVRNIGLDETVVDPLDPTHAGDRHRVSANVSFWPTEFSRLRLQGSADLPDWLPDPIWAGVLQLEVLIGSHGAHTF